jgi:hypothetical protein
MKQTIIKTPGRLRPLVFPKTLHPLPPKPILATHGKKGRNRDDPFSHSRDINGANGPRQVNSAHGTKTVQTGR